MGEEVVQIRFCYLRGDRVDTNYCSSVHITKYDAIHTNTGTYSGNNNFEIVINSRVYYQISLVSGTNTDDYVNHLLLSETRDSKLKELV